MIDRIVLDEHYSTTRRMVQGSSEIISTELISLKKPEDQSQSILFFPNSEDRIGEGGLRKQGYFKKSFSEIPLVTIITVVFNGAKFLEETILSVINQTYDNVEYIIVDGGSTDGTLDIIRKYEHAIDYWVSEKDQGIYDAMNKGIMLATGSIIGIVNADDLLLLDAIAKVVIALGKLGEPGYTYGYVELINLTGKRFGIRGYLPQKLRYKRRYLEMPGHHLAVFVSSLLYKRFGVFDTNFKIRADYDLLLRFMHNSVPSVDLADTLGKFRVGGASGGLTTWLETFAVHKKHGVNKIFSLYCFIRSVFKTFGYHLLPSKAIKTLKKLTISYNQYD